MKKYIRSSNYGLVFENYGDENFLDGGCVVARDPDNSSCYYVITCNYVYDTPGDHHYLIQDCYVDWEYDVLINEMGEADVVYPGGENIVYTADGDPDYEEYV